MTPIPPARTGEARHARPRRGPAGTHRVFVRAGVMVAALGGAMWASPGSASAEDDPGPGSAAVFASFDGNWWTAVEGKGLDFEPGGAWRALLGPSAEEVAAQKAAAEKAAAVEKASAEAAAAAPGAAAAAQGAADAAAAAASAQAAAEARQALAALAALG